MAKLEIDTSDDPVVLRAVRNMLNELLGETQHVAKLEGRDEIFPGVNPPTISVASEGFTDDSTPAELEATTVNPVSPADTRVDANGVGFNATFCGNAAKPFYGSGKRSGQWKRRQGADEGVYDTWYAEQLALVASENPGVAEDEPINTAGAFGGEQQAASDPIPEDCGAFMGWVSAKQAAGLLTQGDIGEAYSQAGIQVTDLFPPNDEGTVKRNVGVLYQTLVVKAGA